MGAGRKVEVFFPSDREVAVRRVFDAPRELVFEAHTHPEIVKRWHYGPDDWRMSECTIDLRVGGRFRYVWSHIEKGDMGMVGTFREIVPPERIVHTEIFDEDWTGGETVVTTTFEESRDGRTIMISTVLFISKEARDAALKTGMTEGWTAGIERLAALFLSLGR